MSMNLANATPTASQNSIWKIRLEKERIFHRIQKYPDMRIKQLTHTNEILLNPKFRIVFAVSVVNDSGEGMRCTEEKWINNTSNIEIILNSSILEFRFAPPRGFM